MVSLLMKATRSLLRCSNRIFLKSYSYPKFNPVKYQRRALSVFAEFKLPNNISSDIENHSISPDKKHLTISWKVDNTQTNEYYSLWLRHQCHCEKCLQTGSDQNLVNPDDLDPPIFLEELSIKDDCVYITWKYKDGRIHKGFISLHWLYHMKRKLQAKKSDVKLSLPELEFEEILSSDEGLYKYLSLLNQHGMIKVVNAPGEKGGIQLAERISFRLPSFYGLEFDVIVVDDPIDAAYSNVRLNHHMDFAYYYHMAGLQHLHCIRNDPCVKGGILTLSDIYEIAENFRKEYPEYFHTLSRVPVIFHHLTFTRQTYMEVRSTIFSLDHNGDISYVRWSPAPQGPVIETKDASTLDAFFTAYNQFYRYVENYPPKATMIYRPGEVVSFHNFRMIHARTKIELNGGIRSLKGCYTPIDEFLSRLRYLSIKLGKPLSAPLTLF